MNTVTNLWGNLLLGSIRSTDEIRSKKATFVHYYSMSETRQLSLIAQLWVTKKLERFQIIITTSSVFYIVYNAVFDVFYHTHR